MPYTVEMPPEIIEFKAVHGIAGFLGAIVSLGIARYPSIFRQVTVLVAGAATGMFLAPIVQEYLEVSSRHGYAIALLMGLVAMPLATGAHVLASRWRDDPISVIRMFRGGKRGD